MKKPMFICAAIIFVFTGCSTLNMSKLIGQLKDDPATVNVSIQSVYGTVKFVRTNPGTNSTVTVTPDGTVSVERK